MTRAPSRWRIRLEKRRQRRRTPLTGWIGWDPTPALHPWLTPGNLDRMREFSREVREQARLVAERAPDTPQRYAFVGNLANYLYLRAGPLRRHGLDIALVPHPHDVSVMSQPGWEHFAGSTPTGVRDVAALAAAAIELPGVPDVVRFELRGPDLQTPGDVRAFLREHRYFTLRDVVRYPDFLPYVELLDYLQDRDALLTTQATYLAYLSRRPYLATQGGGDLWIECSRADRLGELQRLGFGHASGILASNPWTFAHARRFGFRNAFYLPLILDDGAYAPGEPTQREAWRAQVGGSFFVLSTSRLDDAYKGSRLALAGFRRFAEAHPEARLVLVGWGKDEARSRAQLREWGIADRTLVLPVAGKRLLVEHLRSADVLLDQFSLGAYGATALEALACGLPVVMRLELQQYAALCEAGPPPVLNATTDAEIEAALLRLAGSDEKRHSVGEASRSWFLAAHGASTWADAYGHILRATALGHRPEYRRSPLAEQLSEEEREYHAAGLRAAPPQQA